jgi:hypothetical protein
MGEEGTGEGWTTYQQTEAQSARTFALVGFVFYAIGAAAWGSLLVAALVTFFFIGISVPFGFGAFGFIFPLIPLGVSVGLTVWSWSTLQRIERGGYQDAQAPVLVLGILGFFFSVFIGGIFLIMAYVKLGNVISPRPAYPVAPQPAGGRVCPNCGRPIPMDAKFCNHCGHEMP